MDTCPHCGKSLVEFVGKFCPQCGNAFRPNRKWQKFCSSVCNSRYHYAERLKKKEKEGAEQ